MLRNFFLYRPVWLPVTITAALLALSLALLLASAWRGMERLQPLHEHLNRMTQTEAIAMHIETILIDHLNTKTEISADAIKDVHGDIEKMLSADGKKLGPDIRTSLQHAQQALSDNTLPPLSAITIALNELKHIVKGESVIHQTLVREAWKTADIELVIAGISIVVLPALGLLILFVVRNRILLPLNNLGWLMSQLGHREFSSATILDVDPMLAPLLDRYNGMVNRLTELEREHNARHESLEGQVRAAASNLLEQQRNLANAERLSAVGELAAHLAHELRNPLAGMQLALENLRQETTNSEHAERLDLIADELARVTSLLNGLLDQARHQPEVLRNVNLHALVGDLLKLARYQVPEHIEFSMDIPESLQWPLPENGLRRSLLNLVLNACHALDNTPGAIRISARQEGRQLRLEVCDDGPGFPQAILESKPRAFHTLRPGGTGLGLSLVQQFAHELNGSFTLSNLEPHGACAQLTIPKGESHV
jgi:two-component system NtrC family sensor kinase